MFHCHNYEILPHVTPTGIQTIAIFHDQISSGKTDTPRCNEILEEDTALIRGHEYLSGGENVNISTLQTSPDNNTTSTIHHWLSNVSRLLNITCYRRTQSSSKIELEMMGCYPQDRCHLRSYFGVLENRRTQRAAVFSWNIRSIYITSREIETGLLTLSTNTFIPIFVGHERTDLGRM